MHRRDKSADPAKIAAKLGFRGSSWKTLETGCGNELDYHFLDPGNRGFRSQQLCVHAEEAIGRVLSGIPLRFLRRRLEVGHLLWFSIYPVDIFRRVGSLPEFPFFVFALKFWEVFHLRGRTNRSMTPATDSTTLDRQLAYAVFRLTLGINILVHGAGRIFGPARKPSPPPRRLNSARRPCPLAWCTHS